MSGPRYGLLPVPRPLWFTELATVWLLDLTGQGVGFAADLWGATQQNKGEGATQLVHSLASVYPLSTHHIAVPVTTSHFRLCWATNQSHAMP